MHDTDNDGTITLEEYRHVSSGFTLTYHIIAIFSPIFTNNFNIFLISHHFASVQVVDELLSLSETLEKDTAKSIADAAMLEVASISMGHMVCKPFYPESSFSWTHCLFALHH